MESAGATARAGTPSQLMPRVSVIMPAHDSAAVLPESLESVRAQTFADWEVIVADDASSDDSAAVAAAHGARVVRTEHNLGPAGARNLALREATGELVAFLDADDWWLPEYLERQVARYDAERDAPPVGIVACDAHISTDGRFVGRYSEQFRAGTLLSLEGLLRRNVLFVSCLVPRAAVEEVGGFDESLFGTEDHDLWIRILERGYRAVLTPEPLCVYRRTSGSISLNVARQAANNQKTYRSALARGRLTPSQQRIARSELRYNRALEAVAAAALSRERRPHAFRRLAERLPTVIYVVLSRPRQWGDWARALRGGRAT